MVTALHSKVFAYDEVKDCEVGRSSREVLNVIAYIHVIGRQREI